MHADPICIRVSLNKCRIMLWQKWCALKVGNLSEKIEKGIIIRSEIASQEYFP